MRYFNAIVIAVLMTIIPCCVYAKGNMVDGSGIIGQQNQSVNILSAHELYDEAYGLYCSAKMCESEIDRNNFYAKAINSISKAIALDEENENFYMLGSQIYRGKGGIVYAKGYFNFAESIFARKIVNNPDDIGANLDYAIACYAGDVKFWDNYNDYEQVAIKHANRVISLCNDLLKSKKNSSLLRAKAIANLIIENQGEAQRLFKESKDLDSESEIIAFFKSLIPSNAKSPTTANIMYCELYENTIDKSTWLWPVGAKHVTKEFLLYYLADLTRNNDL